MFVLFLVCLFFSKFESITVIGLESSFSVSHFFQHYACRNGHKEIACMLLQKGADPNVQTRSGGATPLHRAAYAGHLEIVDRLLSCGATPCLCDEDGKTSLHKVSLS